MGSTLGMGFPECRSIKNRHPVILAHPELAGGRLLGTELRERVAKSRANFLIAARENTVRSHRLWGPPAQGRS